MHLNNGQFVSRCGRTIYYYDLTGDKKETAASTVVVLQYSSYSLTSDLKQCGSMYVVHLTISHVHPSSTLDNAPLVVVAANSMVQLHGFRLK